MVGLSPPGVGKDPLHKNSSQKGTIFVGGLSLQLDKVFPCSLTVLFWELFLCGVFPSLGWGKTTHKNSSQKGTIFVGGFSLQSDNAFPAV